MERQTIPKYENELPVGKKKCFLNALLAILIQGLSPFNFTFVIRILYHYSNVARRRIVDDTSLRF